MSVFVPFIHRVRKKEEPKYLPLYIEKYRPPIEKSKQEETKEERGVIIIEL